MYIYVYKYILIRMYTLKECGDLKLRGLLLPCLHCRGEKGRNLDHHKSTFRSSVTGDSDCVEYDLKTCIPHRLANP